MPTKFKVSAIISTYNSEKFIAGCLLDLVDQTLYKKGELEIIVIDSASEQNEQSIVQNFQIKYPNIVYDRTPNRETLYGAWNRGIKMSRGAYITNANTDDRHRPDALEVMAHYLDTSPETSLVYADQLITTIANDTWATNQAKQRWNWPAFNYSELEERCIIGPQPMWRKSLHEKYGYFRSEFTAAGDYDFWLRIGKTENIVRLQEILGLYYCNPRGLEHASPIPQQETDRILDEYGILKRSITPKTSEPVSISPSELNALPSLRPTQPLASIIIPTKDRPEMLAEAVQSVIDQTLPDLEIIVVNDGGTDVQEVLDRLNSKGNIVYLSHPQNQERSAARNTGIRVAHGKYIAYLDDDDMYHSNHIQTLVDFLENSKYKVAYSDAVMAEQQKQNGKYVTINRSVPYSIEFDYDRILVGNFIPILCLMHEKSCLDETGLFDVNLGTHEDWDLLIRLSRKFSIAHIKETTCEFTRREDGTTTTSKKRGDFTRTRKIIYDRYKEYAQDKPGIIEAQQAALKSELEELASLLENSQTNLASLQSQFEESQQEKQFWQQTAQQMQTELEKTQQERDWIEHKSETWKQTAEQMQIELDRALN
jgi:O-antigen biosynthesis protein